MTIDLFAVRWVEPTGGGPAVRLLDQTLLPERVEVLDCRDVETLAEAIRSLRVRGAPALGVAGAYGVVLGALVHGDAAGAAELLTAQRPTAVNLRWACERVLAAGEGSTPSPQPPSSTRAVEKGSTSGSARRGVGNWQDLLAEARRIEEENAAACEAMGRHGAALVRETGARRFRLLTHCNTGMLGCQGIGTAFGVVRTLFDRGALAHVWVDETRPLLQGSRLTAFEAAALGIPHAVIPDGAAASVMSAGQVDAVVVGADRIAANGDVANKVGTCTLAILARHYGLPFYVVAPTSTIDLATSEGAAIEIELRDADEVRTALGRAVLAPTASPAHNPAFDVTGADLVTAIVTERGVARPPYRSSLSALVRAAPA